MISSIKYFILVFTLALLSLNLNAQNEVTQFLGIPIDGYKSEMIQKLKSKGFTISTYKKEVLAGEFNGTNVILHVGTNNNKVFRIMVADVNSLSEADIRIRFNNLLNQFKNNKKYLPTPDSTISKWIISEDEDISYEISVNSKRYEALFYQKTLAYDSLTKEQGILLSKKQLTDTDIHKLTSINSRLAEESVKSLEKPVWFMINESYGKYFISIFYDNEYNRAKGDEL